MYSSSLRCSWNVATECFCPICISNHPGELSQESSTIQKNFKVLAVLNGMSSSRLSPRDDFVNKTVRSLVLTSCLTNLRFSGILYFESGIQSRFDWPSLVSISVWLIRIRFVKRYDYSLGIQTSFYWLPHWKENKKAWVILNVHS